MSWWDKKSLDIQGGVVGGDVFGPEGGPYQEHIGTKRHSGRYRWGSGENPYQHEENFLKGVKELRDRGMTDMDIARSYGMSSTEFRHRLSGATNMLRAYQTAEVARLRDKGMGWTAIAKRMGLANESTARTLYSNIEKVKNNSTRAVADILKEELKEHPYLDVSSGVEHYLNNVTKTKLDNAVALLKKDGYSVEPIRVDQASDPSKQTTIKVLAAPGTTQKDIWKNKEQIEIPQYYFSDENTIEKILPMKSIDSKRIDINYADTGNGKEKDGLIELRRGVNDISLGNADYAQVRIAVDGTHYLKGMAVYSDDLPPGIDIRFNTNKNHDIPALGPKDNSVLKPLKSDPGNPFGASIKGVDDDDDLILAQRHYIDENGERQLSAINIVKEEGDWNKYRKSLPSQFLAKQSPQLAKQQLDIKAKAVQADYEDILTVTNPTVKKKLLDDFARQCDANAEDLSAASLPRQATKVILPVPSLKEGEIFAPQFHDGEQVALVRFPHAGRFEIPILTVNNRNKEGVAMMGNASVDAVGINAKAASQLSGADFDGDTALVIPCDNVKIRAEKPLPGLKDFETTDGRYAAYKGMHVMTKHEEGVQMGKISNLITDMTVKGAPPQELERAVRHSMVVIDARKHELNYKLSEEVENISELQLKYQKQGGGASTLLSRAGAEINIPDRREVSLSKIKEIARETGNTELLDAYNRGEMIYENTGKTKKSGRKQKDGTYKDVIVEKTLGVSRMDVEKDARALYSDPNAPTRIEQIYAEYANTMKSMANQARAASRATKDVEYSPSAAKVYAEEVGQLKDALHKAQRNAPLERKAQIVAKKMASDRIYNAGVEEADKKKQIRAEELKKARERFGAGKELITITDNQWKAINAGAVSKSFLESILNNCDMTKVRERTTPRDKPKMSSSNISRAKSMLSKGYTLDEVASMLNVAVSTMTSALGLYDKE